MIIKNYLPSLEFYLVSCLLYTHSMPFPGPKKTSRLVNPTKLIFTLADLGTLYEGRVLRNNAYNLIVMRIKPLIVVENEDFLI